MPVLLLLAVALLAFANGANDNFKGVAALRGSGITGYRRALLWATAATFAGSLAAFFLAGRLLEAFSGKGLVPAEAAADPAFLLAVALGAGATVLLATRTGFPVSTTHALVGGLAGAALATAPGALDRAALLRSFLLPLLVSPAAAAVLGAGLHLALRALRLRLGAGKEWCVCIGEDLRVAPVPRPASLLAVEAAPPRWLVQAGPAATCRQRYTGRSFGLSLQGAVEALHFLSAGLVSFSRGLNDTPKIAGLLLVLPALPGAAALAAVGLAIALGGLLAARRVADTLSGDLTEIRPGPGLAANLATGFLVLGASRLGLPVSTTHVSVGSLAGIGATTRQGRPRAFGAVLLSWILTLPCAALLAAAARVLL